ncbi:MAG: SAM-dependent methyltransferase [Clostridia bacterium]|nr:SAM-dependent methyltransferase [Clostridia bacterium]
MQQSNSGDKAVVLSERLFTIVKSLPKNAVVCDVGSDHGALPLFLLKEFDFSKVIVTDLNPKPLERAKENLFQAGVADRACFLLTDGIENVFTYQPDVFVIAGMGGETISGILDRAILKIPIGTKFVLQPMTREETLRSFLYEFGFAITDEKVVFENNKFFPIIWCTFVGEKSEKKSNDCFLGEFLPKDQSESTKLYFQFLLKRVEKKLKGKESVGENAEIERMQRELLCSLIGGYYED